MTKKNPVWGLYSFRSIRNVFVRLRWLYYVRVWGMDIHPTASFSLSIHLDKTNPRGIHIGEESYIANGVVILAHDLTRGIFTSTRVGKRCFVGVRSIILPGVQIGDECVIGAGSVVTKDVPARSLVAGNPARILRSDIKVISRYGRMETRHD